MNKKSNKSFQYMGEKEYECVGIRNRVKEYVHEQTDPKVPL